MKFDQTQAILNAIFDRKRTLCGAFGGNPGGATINYKYGSYKTLEEIGEALQKFKFSAYVQRGILSKIQRTMGHKINEAIYTRNKVHTESEKIDSLLSYNRKSMFGIEGLEDPKYLDFLTNGVLEESRKTLQTLFLEDSFDEPDPNKDRAFSLNQA